MFACAPREVISGPAPCFQSRGSRKKLSKTAFCCNVLAGVATLKFTLFGRVLYINFSSGDNLPYSLE